MGDTALANSDTSLSTTSPQKTVLITGISKGIGAALCKACLQRGYLVCGISREQPEPHPNLLFEQADMTQFNQITEAITRLKARAQNAPLDILFLNAGTFGDPPAYAYQVPMEAFLKVFMINVAAVKATIDACLTQNWRPTLALASASISSKRPRPGISNYATSKAALNALIKVYQLENPDINFLPLGLCNVRTSGYAVMTSVDKTMPELYALKQRAERPGYVVSPEQRAEDVMTIVDKLPELGLVKGEFYEIRELLKTL